MPNPNKTIGHLEISEDSQVWDINTGGCLTGGEDKACAPKGKPVTRYQIYSIVSRAIDEAYDCASNKELQGLYRLYTDEIMDLIGGP